MNTIHVISASAGSGKTHRLVDELERAITRKENPVRPEAVIATTFTVKAAAELRERVRARLLEGGHVVEAQRLSMARIGTVNSVCSALVTEFAFELGLPAELRILEEDAARSAFEHSLAGLAGSTHDESGTSVSGSDAAAALLELEERMPGLDWLLRVREIVEKARANRLDAAALRACASRSAETLMAHLPAAGGDGTKIEETLLESLEQFVAHNALDDTKKTKGVVEQCQRVLASLRGGRALPWTEWARLAEADPAVKSRTLFDPVRSAAQTHDRHPQLVADVRAAINGVFELAAQSLEAYRQHKLEWGSLDFTDQECLALDLLGRPHVREILAEQVDLVLVDEFQDTSPLQLELFLSLARIAPQSVWVGDQKQSIYGFRGTDPLLMDAAIAAIEANAGAGALETLAESWRSRAELVRLTSDVFAPAFAARGIPDARVRLRPASRTADPDQLGPVVEVWRLAGSNKGDVADALATAVTQLLSDPAVRVRDLITGEARRPRPVDVAVLCPKNSDARQVASALEALRVPAVIGRPRLVATPEARAVLSALRLWINGRDSLAAAELGRLVSLPDDPDAWLGRVIEAQGRPFADLAEVERIATARTANPAAGLLAAFDTVLAAIGARELCLRWGNETQRIANLDRLRALAVAYTDGCVAGRETPTVAGLVAYFESLAKDKSDEQATPAGQDAVTVSTLHGAKGLEWPVTILFGLEGQREPTAFGVHVASERATISLEDPLGGRWIRYWPDPYQPKPNSWGGSKTSGGSTTLHAAVLAGDEHAAEEERATSEELRLLYVGWTRARDVLVLASKDRKLLDGRLGILTNADGAPLLAEPDKDGVATWAGRRIDARVRVAAASEMAAAVAEPGLGYAMRDSRDFPPAVVSPSTMSGAGKLRQPEAIGRAMTVQVGADPTALGSACHAFFAADGDRLDDTERIAMATRLLKSFGVLATVRAEELVAAGAALRGWVERRWPRSEHRREWPIQQRLRDGSEMHGFADLVLQTPEGLVLIDHKCIGGSREEVLASANSFGAQIAAYADALKLATGRSVTGRWLHMPLHGMCVEIE